MINPARLSVRGSGPTALRPILLALASGAVAPVAAQEVSARVEVTESGERLLIHEVVVPATLAQLWAAFTTAEGFMGWAAPFAVVDLRIGGSIESSYNAAARPGDAGNIINRMKATSIISHRGHRVPGGRAAG